MMCHCRPGYCCPSCREGIVAWRFGVLRDGRYRAEDELLLSAPFKDPHGQMQRYAEQLPAGSIKKGDAIVACRLSDGALFVKPVRKVSPPTTQTVELEG